MAKKRLALPVLAVLALAGSGCRLASNAPNPSWVADFQKADSILIRKHKEQLAISDSDTIDRLKNIYANAKWTPYWHTLPANVDDRTIDLFDGETKLRDFSYTGSLWETTPYSEDRTTKHRTAKLSETDRQWIESLFAEIPDSEAATKNEMPLKTIE